MVPIRTLKPVHAGVVITSLLLAAYQVSAEKAGVELYATAELPAARSISHNADSAGTATSVYMKDLWLASWQGEPVPAGVRAACPSSTQLPRIGASRN